MNILQAIDDPQVFAPFFRDAATWRAWRSFLAALFGLPMDDEQADLYRECTGRSEPPSAPASEGWLIVGRRGGKSFTLALIAVFLAGFRDWRPHLAPGERATVMVIAADRRQARVVMRYIRALMRGVPMLARTIERETIEALDLHTAVTIEVHTASFRTTRGYTVVAGLLDEIAFWPTDDAANPDTEIIAGLRPAMATVPGAMLLCASSPYARRGALWEARRRHWGQDGPVLVWQAGTRTMNPCIPEGVIADALAEDPARAQSEYLAEFRSDIEGFVAREAVEACVSPGIWERPPVAGANYNAFCDPSGGSNDAMTLAIAHREEMLTVIDAVREVRPPFSPEAVVAEFAGLLKRYGVHRVRGDRYGGEWPAERFRVHGIAYEAAASPKSDLFRDLLPMINSRTIELLDHPRLVRQLCSLERRTSRAGRDSIDHPPGGHDDLANAVAGAAMLAAEPRYETGWVTAKGLY